METLQVSQMQQQGTEKQSEPWLPVIVSVWWQRGAGDFTGFLGIFVPPEPSRFGVWGCHCHGITE